MNEPVAYIDPYDLERLPHYDCHIGSQQLKNGIPLYTHPVKQLSDEEILNICWQKGITWYKLSDGNMDEKMMIDFARAIIKEITE